MPGSSSIGRRRIAAGLVRALPVLAALLGTLVATLSVRAHEERDAIARQDALATAAAAAARATTQATLDRLSDLAVSLPREDAERRFRRLAPRLLTQRALSGASFVVRVPEARRRAFEARTGMTIVETKGTGVARAGPRPTHYVIAAAVSRPGSVSAVATDLAADPLRLPVLHAAFLTDSPQATPAVSGLRVKTPTVAVYVPLRERGARAVAVLGGAYRVPRLERAIADGLPSDVAFRLEEGGRPLDPDRPAVREPQRVRLPFAGREWAIAVGRPPADTELVLLVAIAGGLLTALLAAVVVLAARREGYANRLVAERMAERDRAEQAQRRAEDQAALMAETSSDMLISLDHGVITWASPAAQELLGYEPHELVGRTIPELMPPDEQDPSQTVLAALARGEERLTLVHRMLRADGTPIWIESTNRFLADGRTTRSALRDVSARVATEHGLAEAEALFRTAFDDAPIGMAMCSLDGVWQRVNHALCGLVGLPREELEGRRFSDVVHSDELNEACAAVAGRDDDDPVPHRGEQRLVHADGHLVWVAVTAAVVHDAGGRPLHILVQLQDITDHRRHEAELRHLADHDDLTGLLNRRAFERELDRHVALVRRYGARGALLVLDLDHFKTVNDTLGHSAGDDLVARVAEALRARMRQTDVLARLGGDEFAVLVPEGGAEEARLAGESVLAAVRDQVVPAPSGRERPVTASVGIALFEGGESLTGEEVLIEADLAMYDAKEAGRDRLLLAERTDSAPEHMRARVAMPDAIRDALAEDRFELHAQPIIDLASGAAAQYELLLRMRDERGELLPPASFLGVAERYDLLGSIDRWVARRAIRMLAERLPGEHPLTLEVNLSGRSLGDPRLLDIIEDELAETGVDPRLLVFEVTETTAVASIPRAQDFAARLADLGCRFALDDFGAGFGSFYYLKHLPFDFLKIDGEFVRSCTRDATDRLVIAAVVDIARGLGARTVAEHVGDRETVDALTAMGVDLGQGYHLGRPRPLAEWLAAPPRPRRRALSA